MSKDQLITTETQTRRQFTLDQAVQDNITGNQLNVIEELNLLLEEELTTEERIKTYLQLGLAYRLISPFSEEKKTNPPHRSYGIAKQYFEGAQALAHDSGDWQAEMTATTGLVDVHRTASYDPPYYKFLQSQLSAQDIGQDHAREVSMQSARNEAERLATLLTEHQTELALPIAHANENLGLLALETHDGQLYYSTPIEYYQTALKICEELLETDLTQEQLNQVLLRKIRIASLLGDIRIPYNEVDRIQILETTFDQSSACKYARGMINCAKGIAEANTQLGNKDQAIIWWEKAHEAATASSDTQNQDIAQKAIAKLG